MTVADAVSGKEKMAGVCWLLVGRETEQLLRQTLSMLLGDAALLGPCHLRRVRFKPGHKLTANYDVCVQGHGTRPVAVIWRGHRSAGWRKVKDQIDTIEAEAAARGLLAPFRALAAESREWNLRVQVAPLDVDFPQLVRVFDRRYFTEKLRNALDGYGEVSGGSTARCSEVNFVRYQPGLRHVLRYELESEGGNTSVFAKLSPPDQSARAFQVSRHASEWLAAHPTSVTCVRPLAFDAADSVILYPHVVGLPLSEHLRRPSRDLMSRLRQGGEALNLLHCLPKSLTLGLELQNLTGEIEEITQASEFVQVLLPEVGATIHSLLDCAGELHPQLPQELPTYMHGDLKIEHLLVTESGLTLIDFDTCRLGDPALDVGTFLADLRLCYSIYNLPGVEGAQKHFLEGYCSGAPDERLVRARLYEAVELVKMTVRRVQLFDDHWASQTEKLVSIARLVMERLQEKLGLRAKRSSSNKVVHLSPSFADSGARNDPRCRARRGRARNS